MGGLGAFGEVSVSLTAIQSQIKLSIATKESLHRNTMQLEKLVRLAQNATQCLKRGGKVIFAGNGGRALQMPSICKQNSCLDLCSIDHPWPQ